MKHRKTNQQGSIEVIAVAIVTFAIIGLLGFIYWDNFLQSEDSSATTKTTAQTSTQNQDESTQESKDPNEGYFVLEEWELKFKLPEGLTDTAVRYYQRDEGDIYEFTTQRVEDFGEQCVEPVESELFAIRLVAMSRNTTDLSANGESYQGSAPINNTPINGYYYYASHGHSTCAIEGAMTQKEDRDLLYKMLLTAESL